MFALSHSKQIIFYSIGGKKKIKFTNIEFSIKRQQKTSTKKASWHGKPKFPFNMLYVQKLWYCHEFFKVFYFGLFFLQVLGKAAFSSFNQQQIYFCKFHIMKNKCYAMQMMSLTCQNIITQKLLFFLVVLRTPKVN